MKNQEKLFTRVLDGLFNSPVVTLFQHLSGYTSMADGYELDGIRVVRDGVVTVCIVEIGSGELALVDAGYDRAGTAILRELERRGADSSAVKAILLTHGHIDHIGAVPLFPDAQVMVLTDDVDLTEGRARSRGALSMILPPNQLPIKVSRPLTDGDMFKLGNRTVRVYAIPGHTPGSAAFLIDDILIVGDTAFSAQNGKMVEASCPFTDDVEQSRQSLKRLAARLESEGLPVKAIFFSHAKPLEKGLAPLLEFAEGVEGK
ncbi:MAG: MBL fold metallo-hydrolase [Myxococcota bacterium]|jgi:glyoxylase-like metal-dependent hydrolase (beta-lactamase superfamily II)